MSIIELERRMGAFGAAAIEAAAAHRPAPKRIAPTRITKAAADRRLEEVLEAAVVELRERARFTVEHRDETWKAFCKQKFGFDGPWPPEVKKLVYLGE